MEITAFTKSEQAILQAFLIDNNWPHHVNRTLTNQQVLQWFEEDKFTNENCTFIAKKEGQLLGFITIEDVEDEIVTIDMRVAEHARNQGVGTALLTHIQHDLFTIHKKQRIEGYTKAENLAMQKCFKKAGFVKEGYLRQAWRNQDGTISDSILFAAIPSDWATNLLNKEGKRDESYN